MRASLLTGLMDAMQTNANHGTRDVKLFEIGKVFETSSASKRPREREVLSLAVTGSISPDEWRGNRPIDFYDLKGAIESVLAGLNLSGFTIERGGVEYLHPGQAAAMVRDGQVFARFGRLHPRVAALYKFRQPVYVGEIEFERLLDLPADEVRYSALPRLPSSSRDISALIADAALWGDIERAIADLGIKEIVSVRLFDTYKGKGIPDEMRSLAFRVTYRGDGRTLTDEEVATMHKRVCEMMQERFGAQLR
jgi:phenylalanyl-tRNA synthetase beta chain